MPDHWSDEHRQRLGAVMSLEEAGLMATEMLAELRASGKEIVQICGPMTTGGLGNLEANMARFAEAIETARQNGLLVFNQIPFQEVIIRVTNHHNGGSYEMDILEVFYRTIFESGHVSRALFLPDWESSRGATWERDVVTRCGISVEEYPSEWLLSTQEA
jgi:hypothetical protein